MHNVLVTGGSRGIGLGIVRRLAAAGYHVVVVARTMSDGLTAVAADSARGGGGEVEFIPFDLGEVDGIAGIVRKLRRDRGPIYGLVNNAGIGLDGALALMQNQQIERMIRLNTVSPIVLTKYVVRHMLADGGGRVVNIASIVGSTGYSGLSVYSATKGALIGFTRSLAREVGRMGVTVNAVAPGFVDTEMTHGLEGERREQVVRRSALKRLVDVDDVAEAVHYLLGPGARNVTGTVLTVDGGATA